MSDAGGFATGKELFEALGVPDAVERRKTLAWIAEHPPEAIELGRSEGLDVVEALVSLINRDWDYKYWRDLAITIGTFDAPRVTDFFIELLEGAEGGDQAMDAAIALEPRREGAGVRDRVTEVLLSDGPEDRIAAAAQVLAEAEGLPPAASVRISLFEREPEAPPIGEGTVEAWLAELRGPLAESAREALEEQGEAAVQVLEERWSDLDDDTREWLVDFAAAAAPAEAATKRLLVAALDSGERTALAALRALPSFPEATIPGERLRDWAESERPEVRAAAIEAGAPVDAGAVLESEDADSEIRIAALRALARSEGTAAAGRIAPQLGSGSPELRNAARDSLVELGEPAVEHLRPLVKSDSVELRAAAVRALLDLGDDEWLAAELLEGSSG